MAISGLESRQSSDGGQGVRFGLHAADVLILGFTLLLGLLTLALGSRLSRAWIWFLADGLLVVFVMVLSRARRRSARRFLVWLHDWYVAPVVLFFLKQACALVKEVHQLATYDDLLIAMDRWIFGADPTRWLAQFSHPAVTEVLQFAYTLFYALFLMVGFELYRGRRFAQFDHFRFTCVYGFCLSYLGYFLLPAVGPRFVLHDFSRIEVELPGLFLTPYLRWLVNAGSSIPAGLASEMAVARAPRDVFPSGHTMMTLVLVYSSYRYAIRIRHLVGTVGTLIVVAAVYQRYHYVVDLIAGGILALLCLATAGRLRARVIRTLRGDFTTGFLSDDSPR